ncbi:MAG: hypothetical protein IJO06_02430 [Thermoguttaceae bacterium]|nr:hypothetical protein [Thermoguttaceae bacterium]
MRPNEYRDRSILRPQARRRIRRGGRVERLGRDSRGRFFTWGSWKSFLVAFVVVGLWTLFQGLRGGRDE